MVEQLFTIESLLSLQGAALASLLVPNVLGYVFGKSFNKYRKYISLLIAFGLAFIVASFSNIGWVGWIIAVFNGFLIFASAVGINQMTSSQKKEIPVQENRILKTKSFMKLNKKSKKEFFSNWF
jgi:hypothetical protein